MGRPSKKKGGKKDTPVEDEPSQSNVTVEEPSTSDPPAAEVEDDSGLTGAARKKKEKKEKKEKALQALQALQASRKPSSLSESKTESEQPSRAQSETPSEPSVEAQLPSDVPPEAPAKAKEPLKTEEAEDFGLGLTSSKKKKPRKKKADTQPPAAQQASSIPEVQAVTTDLSALSLSGSTAQVTPPVSAPSGQVPAPVSASIAQVTAPVSGPSAPVTAPLSGPSARVTSHAAGPSSQVTSHAAGPSSQVTSHAAGPSSQVTSPVAGPSAQVSSPISGPGHGPVLVQMPRPAKASPPGAWGRGTSAGRGRGWAANTGPPPGAPPVMALPTPMPMPAPVAKKSDTQQQSFRQKSLEPVLCRYKIPNKIPGGTVNARPIRVLVNYLQMEFKSLKISRYDVSFTPERPKKMLPEAFAKIKAKFFPNDLIAFDQMKNCYSLHPLKNVKGSERFTATAELIDQNGRALNFEVSLKATGVVDLENIRHYMTAHGSSLCHPTEEVQCIDVILRQGALESYVKAGRQFFKRPKNPVDLGYGYEMWTGLFQSAIFTNKAFINIDVAHKGFPKHQSLLDALIKDFKLDPTRPIENQRGGDYFQSFVKGLKVCAILVGNTASAGQRREFVANGIVAPPFDLRFTIDDKDGKSREITVGDYFLKEKNYRLKYPHLNCVWVGSRERSIYFPIEFLTVVEGQPLARQLNEVQVSKMVKEAATPPDERLRKITEVISNMKYSQNQSFKKFGLEISDKFYTVRAKVLEPPVLDIGNGKARPRNGQWQANRLLKPEALQSWGLIAVDTDPRNEYDSMIDLIKSTGTQLGMSIAEPKLVHVHARMNNLRSILMNAQKDVRFVFIIVSARGRDDYHKVKQLAERDIGILTQCVKESTVRRMNVMTAKNILLKVNSKLMGINQAIDSVTMPKCLKEGGVMVVGADVTHPSPDQSNVPSIAAVTASLDPKCYIYNIELSIQTPKKEMIVQFQDMMFDHLKLYRERNNSLPKKIFVFRDGVSEGQFAQVMNSELSAVHLAYERMAGQAKRPEVLFLLVQKRHHTRLFNEGNNCRYNVEPGTVVDTDIVHSSELDFYLVSHQAIKGTARPTRYHAVCNDGKIPDDEVEQLTYYLCHLYSRCMRSVSYPTPTYYAHLACLRARSLTHGERFDNRELEVKPKRLHVLDKMLQFSRMFLRIIIYH